MSGDGWDLEDPRMKTLCKITDFLTRAAELHFEFVIRGGEEVSGVLIDDLRATLDQLAGDDR